MSISEAALNKLSNILSNKKIVGFEIIGRCDESGHLTQTYNTNLHFDEDVGYHVSLVSLSSTSAFPNVVNSNNKFYYSAPATAPSDSLFGTVVETVGAGPNLIAIRELTIPTGAYDISDYNDSLKTLIFSKNIPDKFPIEIVLQVATGRVHIKLSPGWIVYFNKPGTFRKELGWNADTVITDESTLSPSQADIVRAQKIYMACDVIVGSYFKDAPSKILFSFNNTKRYGAPLGFDPVTRQYRELQTKSFNKLVFNFFDEDLRPVNFEGNQVVINIEIKQV